LAQRCKVERSTEFVSLANGIEADRKAVYAALTLPWSNGQTEGQINRLKLIKRQGYGRAKLDLLRVRVLAS
jgi:transposase